MKAEIFCLVRYGRFSDTKEVFDPNLLKFRVSILLVYLLSGSVQRGVLFVLTTSPAVGFLHVHVENFPE